MFKILWQKKVVIVSLVLFLILFPAVSVRPAQMLGQTLFLSIGIDKKTDGYEVSAIISVSQFSPTGTATTKAISGSGNSVNAAIKKIEADQGREISLAHCNLIVAGSGLADENLAATLHYFLRLYEMSNNALIVYTDGDVKKLLETSIADKTGATGGILETIAASDKTATLDEFYKNYLRPSSANIVNIINLNNGGDALDNLGDGAVFKKGKKILTLNPDQMRAVRMVNSKSADDIVVLDNVNGAQVILQLRSKSSKINAKIKDVSGISKPIVSINLELTATIKEIQDPVNPEAFLDIDNSSNFGIIKTALEGKITADLDSALEYTKTDKADFLRFYDYFHRYDTAAFAKYMDGKDIEQLLAALDFNISVTAKIVV